VERRAWLILGHSPVIKATYTCGTLTESQVFAGKKRHVYLHNHIVSAPFLWRDCGKGVELEITQDRACPVTRVKVRVAWGPSLAKAVVRYRMLCITWVIGWLALACARAVSSGQ
jgi:hypothetical protein